MSTPDLDDADFHLAGGRLTIDLAALADNWRDLDKRTGNAEAAALVKGDAYGIGLREAALTFAAAGCGTFFVARPDQGLRLREFLPDKTIYVLDGLFSDSANVYEEAGLRPVLSSWPEVEEWSAHRQAGGKTPAAIHVDTGMNRLGLTIEQAESLANDEALTASLGPALIMSHLACADIPDHELNITQLERFRAVRSLFPDLPASLANSAGIFLGPEYHFDMVRPGISLYGGAASRAYPNPMKPVAILEARILQVRNTPAGDTVGYGATEALERASCLAVVAAGYADGYPRRASSSNESPGARGFIHGQSAPIVGRISMDLITLDVTEIPGATRGEWVELFGHNIPVDEVADVAETIGYELLTRLGQRYRRRYVGGPATL